MLKPIHTEITRAALAGQFSSRALKRIVEANLYQDRLHAQIGHPEYHFDDNAFEKSLAYIEEQRALTISSLVANDAPSAWSAFGRLTHTAQDFYAHSNYVDLWLSRHRNGTAPTPSEIDPVNPDLIQSHALRSGKIYVLELLTLIQPLKRFVMSLLPRDSHAWMNLDSSACGPNFPYAVQAAIQRTKFEFEKTTSGLPQDVFTVFIDRSPGI